MLGQVLGPLAFIALALLPLLALRVEPSPAETTAPHYMLLKAFNLCLASTVISITSVLNFSLAATLAVTLGLPLSLSSPSGTLPTKLAKYSFYTFLGIGWLFAGRHEVHRAIWDWEFLGVWFAPFVCMIYTPFMMQAAVVCLLPP